MRARTASELKLFGIFGIVGACIKDTGKYVMMWVLLKEPAGKVSHVPLFLIWRRVGAQIAEKTVRDHNVVGCNRLCQRGRTVYALDA